jgi:hypothetical protein
MCIQVRSGKYRKQNPHRKPVLQFIKYEQGFWRTLPIREGNSRIGLDSSDVRMRNIRSRVAT